MRITILCTLYYLVFISIVSPAFSQDMGIVTGHRDGTYYKFAQDIQLYTKEFGINLKIYETEGSLDNIEKIRRTPGVQFGITQADVLYFILEQKNDPSLRDYARKLRIIFPLYFNEVHILANSNVRNFEDLTGKKVSVGPKNSGTYLTSTFLFNLSDVKPAKQVHLDAKQSLDKLRTGEIDAMIFVAGQPVPLFAKNITEEDKGFHFLPITAQKITQYYSVGKIKSDSYPWLQSDVPTILVKNILMSFDYRQANCQRLRKVAKIIRDNIQCLKETGHEKWKKVNLNQSGIKRWPRYICTNIGFNSKREYKSRTGCKTGENIPEQIMDCNCDIKKNPTARALCRMRCDARN